MDPYNYLIGCRRRRAWRLAPICRPDGWPLCPYCSTDNLTSDVVQNGFGGAAERERARLGELRCLTCYWRGRLHPSCLARWLVLCPGDHAFWSHWQISLVTLKDYPDMPPAVRHDPQAEHELVFATVDPMVFKNCRTDDVVTSLGAAGLAVLHPLDLVVQFHGLSDRAAILLTRYVVQRVMKGESPDQDRRRSWSDWIKDGVKTLATVDEEALDSLEEDL